MLAFSALNKSISRFRGEKDQFLLSRNQTLLKYERFDDVKYKEKKTKTTAMIIGTPFYEIDNKHRKMGMRGHVL